MVRCGVDLPILPSFRGCVLPAATTLPDPTCLHLLGLAADATSRCKRRSRRRCGTTTRRSKRWRPTSRADKRLPTCWAASRSPSHAVRLPTCPSGCATHRGRTSWSRTSPLCASAPHKARATGGDAGARSRPAAPPARVATSSACSPIGPTRLAATYRPVIDSAQTGAMRARQLTMAPRSPQRKT